MEEDKSSSPAKREGSLRKINSSSNNYIWYRNANKLVALYFTEIIILTKISWICRKIYSISYMIICYCNSL